MKTLFGYFRNEPGNIGSKAGYITYWNSKYADFYSVFGKATKEIYYPFFLTSDSSLDRLFNSTYTLQNKEITNIFSLKLASQLKEYKHIDTLSLCNYLINNIDSNIRQSHYLFNAEVIDGNIQISEMMNPEQDLKLVTDIPQIIRENSKI